MARNLSATAIGATGPGLMRILLIHQNFPGQFRDLAPALCDRGHELKAIGCSQRACDGRIEVLRYEYEHPPQRGGVHRLTSEVDEWIRRGELAGQAAQGLRQRGWAPDVILAHPGWGETMLLKHVFPASPLVIWPELWLRPEHMGLNAATLTVDQAHYLRVKNWLVEGALSEAALAILPSLYQAGSFPQRWQSKIRVLPEGIPDGLFQASRLQSLCISPTVTLAPDNLVLTFISRNLEPMRGFPELMRALPTLQRQLPQLQVVIVGGDDVSYSAAPGDGRKWRDVLLTELEGKLDRSRLHFLGRIPHPELIKLYRRSDLHVYLSNAFVLSWSLLESLACGTQVLLASNPMLQELSQQLTGARLWDPRQQSLDVAIATALKNRNTTANHAIALRESHALTTCVANLEATIMELAGQSF